MILDYKKFIEKDNLLKNELEKAKSELEKNKEEFVNSVLKDLENEFSEYLTPTKDNFDDRIFLLENDYGIRIIQDFYKLSGDIFFKIYSLSKREDKFGFRPNEFDEHEIYDIDFKFRPDGDVSVEDFVSRVVEKLKKKNISRKKAKETRELKRSMKRYNL